ncbi:MAG TPA: hypothetical protein VFH58_13580 [Acidimicrobiales bacterium]|nr:hypothetical protein [Acidimicrobiales bacterium]
MSSRRRTAKAKNPQLGDLTFDDWYETPVFDTEPDERLEQLATSRRAPVRFIGNAMLRLAPDRSGLSEPAAGGGSDQADGDLSGGDLAGDGLAGGEGPATGDDDDIDWVADDREWAAIGGPGEGGDRAARAGRPAGSWRERAGRLLDRWAAMEAASQERLEELVLPKRWRS